MAIASEESKETSEDDASLTAAPEATGELDLVQAYRAKIIEWVNSHHDLLGDEVAEGVFVREIKLGEQRPIGVHLISESSHILFTYEESSNTAQERSEYSVALSIKSSLTEHMSAEEWETWRKAMLEDLPFLKRINKGSGPQSQTVPYFIQPHLSADALDLDNIKESLLKLQRQLSA